MNQFESVLSRDERAAFGLRALYQSRGYRQYKMSKFEEYDLYVRNKDFLVSDNVITFTDTNGRLMALKPDVTLSIIKNATDREGHAEKVYYNENVYRISKGTHSYKEIMQVGLECIGDLEEYHLLEALSLAVESLMQLSGNCVLDLAHLGVVSAILEEGNLSDSGKKQILAFLSEKNLHGAMDVCKEEGVTEFSRQAIRTLITTYGTPDEVFPKLEAAVVSAEGKAALAELKRMTDGLKVLGLDKAVTLDFSVINDMRYYNGLVFRGFVEGIPTGILSGGQYDKLLKKWGRKSRAIGFAVYLDLLEQLDESEEYDVDTVVLYENNSAAAEIVAAVREQSLISGSATAQRTPPDRLKYKQLKKIKE